MLDGNARLNLATFVTTWMEPQADAHRYPAREARPNLVTGGNVQVCWERFCAYGEVEPRPMVDDRKRETTFHHA